MSFDKPLPPAVFGEEPQYVAIRKDIADIRSPMTPVALAQIHQTFPGDWTYITIAEVMERINAKPVPPPPTVPSGDADKLRRLQLAASAYADQVDMFTRELRKAVSET